MKKPELVEGRTPNITFVYKDCSNPELMKAMQKLADFTGWKDPKDLLRFSKLKSTFDKNARVAGRWYQQLTMKHCHLQIIKDKNGNPVIDPATNKPRMKPKWAPNPNAGGQMDLDFRDRAAFEKDYKILATHEFTVKVYKWTAEELHAAGLNATELLACAKMLEDADEDMLADLDDITESDIFTPPVDMDLTIPEPPTEEPSPGEPTVQQ